MRVIYTSGTFDLFHIGHLNLLRRAKKLGDRLVVGVSTDEFIESYKGYKPIMSFKDRMEIIRNIKCVDGVIKQAGREKLDDMNSVGARTIVMGDDWLEKGGIMGGEKLTDAGKKIIYVPYTKGISTTEIKCQIKNLE